MGNFVNLHVHTDGSLLDGAIKCDKLVERLKEVGQTACAISDHGSMIKTYEFYDTLKKNDIKPIIGLEVYMGEEQDHNTFHLLLLAKNNIGLKNLFKLNRAGYDNFYRKPRITMCDLDKYHEGLICTTACLGSELASYWEYDIDYTGYMEYMIKTFGDDFYLEIQPNTMERQIKYNRFIMDLSLRFNVAPIVTCDAHYISKDYADAHDTLLCVQVKKKKDDENRFKFPSNDCYIQSEEEVRAGLTYLPKSFVECCVYNTKVIADKCNVTIEPQDLQPRPKIEGNLEDKLKEECNKGFILRQKQGHFKDIDIKIVLERIRYEVNIICSKGYAGYFLIVQDFANECKRKGIPYGIGRGSVGGCEVAFILGISEIEPIRYGLYFERFLNPTRDTSPDVDYDVSYYKRSELIQYIKDTYGEANTSHIMAENKLTTKAVIRRVLTVYNWDIPVINSLTKLVDDKCPSLDSALIASEELLRALEDTNELEDMRRLEGLTITASMHAAGILILNEPVTEHFPTRLATDKETGESIECSEWNKKIVEKLGGYKFDLLGLKQTDIFQMTLDNIKKVKDIDISLEELYNMDYENKDIYEVLQNNLLSTIFQFTGGSAGNIIRQMKPNCFNDIMVAESICRPGVKEADLYLKNRKQYNETGDWEKDKLYPYLSDILEETYGCIVYQEQTMNIMHKVANWSLGKADSMRKVKDLEEYREDFVKEAISNGYSEEIANDIFDRFDLGYSFNKSHACAYGKTSAICCYLLKNYPLEYYSACLTLELTQSEPQIEKILKEAKSFGVRLLPIDINKSSNKFEPTKDGILCPLDIVKFLGKTVQETIIKKRPYNSLEDFLNKVPKKQANKRTLTNIIKAGAFDSIEPNRSTVLQEAYDIRGINEPVYFYSDEVRIGYEKQAYGFSVTKHPLAGMGSKDINEIEEDSLTAMIGIVVGYREKPDKRGKMMCWVQLDNELCSFEGICFSYAYPKFYRYFKEGNKLSIVGKKQGNQILINNVEVI